MDVLQHLTTLKGLVFRNLIIDDEVDGDLFYSKVLDIHMGRLESVHLDRIVIEGIKSVEQSNLLFSFILGSCPNLKKFKVEDNGITANGSINLDFRANPYLQHIELNMTRCRFYTFQHEPDEHRRDIINHKI